MDCLFFLSPEKLKSFIMFLKLRCVYNKNIIKASFFSLDLHSKLAGNESIKNEMTNGKIEVFHFIQLFKKKNA